MAMAIDIDRNRRFYMLGVIHRDERNREVLSRWIAGIGPDVITLEFTQYGLMFREKNRDRYKKRIDEALEKLKNGKRYCSGSAIEALESFLNMPDEYEIASGYCAERQLPFYLIDMDAFSCLKLQKVDELFDAGNIERLLTEENAGNGSGEATMARLFFTSGIKTATYDDEMYVRDRHMADRISLLMKHAPDKRFLHIAGWRHLEDPHNLYAPLNPLKVFPYD
ncbi:MAG TPA: hypothetical protein PLX02_06675 [Syntrophorhabdaceae bacterium]|nr:hypothetical protein [Syntrophorhabdaceae bacterium]HQM81290.1 hypothetical protein [Syntrophorhabdaceae bacterium]